MYIHNIDISHYGNVKLPTLSPHVLILDELRPSMIETLLEAVSNSKSTDSMVHKPGSEGSVNYQFRSSSACNVPKKIYDETVNLITSIVVDRTLYMLKAKSIELCEPLQFLRYDSKNSGHFSAHTDNAYIDANGTFQYPNPRRNLTTVTYLNDDFEGGDLVLPSVVDDNGIAIRLRPIPGTTVIFPSDLRFMHEVTPVTKGVRYSIVGWFEVK